MTTKPRQRRTDEQRIQELLAIEQAHLARAEKVRAKRLALVAAIEQRAKAMLATVERAKEGGA